LFVEALDRDGDGQLGKTEILGHIPTAYGTEGDSNDSGKRDCVAETCGEEEGSREVVEGLTRLWLAAKETQQAAVQEDASSTTSAAEGDAEETGDASESSLNAENRENRGTQDAQGNQETVENDEGLNDSEGTDVSESSVSADEAS
jgi:hypothetical protein